MMDPPPQKRGRNSVAQLSQPRGSKKSMIRRRTALACEECRFRKRRCDGVFPACGECTRRRSQCIYSSEVEAREWNQSIIQSLRQRLEELERTAEVPTRACEAQSLTAAQCQQQDQSSHEEETTHSKSAGRPNKDSSANEAHLSNTSAASQENFRASSLTVNDIEMFNDEGEPASPAASGPIISSPSAKQNRYSSRCIEPSNLERLMKPIGLAIDRKMDASKSTTSVLPSDCGRSTSPETASLPSARVNCVCGRLLDAVRCHLPLRRQADTLVALYFSRHARVNPVLHRPTFMKQYEALWESRADSEKVAQSCVFLCKQKSKGKLFSATLNTIFALAALFSSRHSERNASYSAEFFRLAEAIDILDLLNEEVGLEFVQLGLLMAFYLQSTERFSKCWNMAGLALMMAQNMGLHFSIAEARKRGLLASYPTQMECEMRTRVWYACILLETEASMTFAQPLMIPIVAKGIKLPEAIDDGHLSDEVGKWNRQPKDLPSLLEFYVHGLKLYDILGQVLDRQECKTDTPADTISSLQAMLSLDSKIMEWRNCLPPYLRYDSSLPECDPLKGAAILEPVPDTEAVLNFPALSKILHCRFLYVRQVIVRPALDLFFERQQNEKPVTITEPTVKAKLKDSMISNIAAQCVLSAVDLVEFLASQIQTRTFVCWWYNIHYLYTSGSTILLGRLCTFDDGIVSSELLSTSWDLCLHHLDRYDNLSSIAQKSSQLLRESAKRLIQVGIPLSPYEGHRSTTDERQNQLLRTRESDKAASGYVAETAQYSTTNEVLDNLLRSGDSLQTSSNLRGFSFRANETQTQMPSLEGNDVWNNTAFECPSWVFMPPISQLETFPLQFEGSNFV